MPNFERNRDSLIFELKDSKLIYDQERSILLCRLKKDGKKIWAKKIYDINYISNVIEDSGKFYIACESSENSGELLAVYKDDGKTGWFIPGKSFLQVIFEGYIYLIFIDEKNIYYLLKVDIDAGTTKWHHMIKNDLTDYTINEKSIELRYVSGKYETLSTSTGKLKTSGMVDG